MNTATSTRKPSTWRIYQDSMGDHVRITITREWFDAYGRYQEDNLGSGRSVAAAVREVRERRHRGELVEGYEAPYEPTYAERWLDSIADELGL